MAAQTTDTYNSGGTWSQTGDKQYPAEVEPKPQGKKPALQALAATGTAVFSGIIDNNSVGEYNPDFFWRDKVLIYDEMMRSDGIIAGVRRAIEQPLLSADWTIVPGCVDDSLERKYGQQQQPQQPQGGASQMYPLQQPAHMFADPAMPMQQQVQPGQPPRPGMPPMTPMPPQQPQRVPAAQPTKRDMEIAAFVKSNLFDDLCYTTGSGQTLYQSWQEVLRHALLHLWYGFAVFEKVWKVEDGFVKLARLTPLLPQTLYRWWVDDSTELVGIQQYVWKAYGYRYINIPVAKLLRFSNQQEGNNFEGVSFLRAAYKHWYYATEFEKIQAIGIQRDAVNFPVINVPADASDADIQAAQALVQNIRAGDAMGATAPPGFTVEFPANHQPFTDVVQTAIVAHHESIARSMMAPFLVQGDTRFGGKSTDESQGTRFLQGLQHCADYVCDIFNQAIRELVDYNYDDVDVYPKLQCSRLSAQDLGALADAVQKLMSGNDPILHSTPELEDFFTENLGLPKGSSNPVDTMNPGSPANAMQPDKGVNPLAGSGENLPNTNMTPHGQSGASADAGGDAGGGGGGMSELSDNVRLLAETFNAIMGVDAVSRGQEHREQVVRLYNPYHRGTGAGGGQFTRKGTAGASAPSAGRTGSGHGGGSTRGRSSGSGSSRSQAHEARSGRGGGGSGGGSLSRGGSGGSAGHSASGRSRAPKSEGESTTKTTRPTFRTPGHVPETRAQASRAHVQWNTERYSHVTDAQGAAERAKSLGKSDPRYALLTGLHDAHIEATQATTHAELASTRLFGPGRARAVEEYTAAQHHYAEVTARIASLKAQIAEHDSGGARSTRSAKAKTPTTRASRSSAGSAGSSAKGSRASTGVGKSGSSTTAARAAKNDGLMKQAFRDWVSGRAHLDGTGKHYRLYNEENGRRADGRSKVPTWGKFIKSHFSSNEEFAKAAHAYARQHPEDIPAKLGKPVGLDERGGA